MVPPLLTRHLPHSEVEVDGSAAQDEEAAKVVAGAADGLRRAGVSSNPENVKGAASQSDEAGDGAQETAQEAAENASEGVTSRLSRVAALEATRVALAGRISAGDCSSGSKERESK